MNNLKRSIYLCLLIILMVSISPPAKAADTYTVDPIHSFIVFKVGHLNIGYVIGMFTEFTGTIVADKKHPEKSSVEIAVISSSVNTHVEKRDEDLQSDNYLNVLEFPEICFKSTKVKKIDDKTYEVTGDMSLHGITKEIRTTVHLLGEGKDPWGGYRIAFSTDFDIMRSDYGMTKEIPGAADKVHISLVTEALKNVEKK
jgi:polyisoprenoid-binding protein YceI